MSKLLFVRSSIFGDTSHSNRIAEEFVASWRGTHPDGQVVVRDLGANPVPHLSQDHLASLMTAADARTPEQKQSVMRADALISELEEADTIVIASPM